jgi:hypothetical protein
MADFSAIPEQGGVPVFEQIVFGMITVFGRSHSIYFNFKNPGNRFKYPGTTEGELTAFLTTIPGMSVPAMRGPSVTKMMDETPLDLNVDRPSAIVLAVPDRSNMQFAQGLPVSLKSAVSATGYCNLRYVRYRADGGAELASEPFAGCKAVVFFATNPPEGQAYGHGFNVHVDVVQRRPDGVTQILPIILDPEVKNPGGGGGNQ